MYNGEAEYNSRNSFLKLMGRHRRYLDRCILNAIGEEGSIYWIDNLFSPLSIDNDIPFYGVRFLKDIGVSEGKYDEIKKDYVRMAGYPSCRSIFDAIGRTESGKLLCIDIASSSEELKSKKIDGYFEQKEALFQYVAGLLNAEVKNGWYDYYSTYINKLYTTLFLNNHTLPANYITVCVIPVTANLEAYATGFLRDIINRNELLGFNQNDKVATNTSICFVSMKGEKLHDLKIVHSELTGN